MNSVKEEEARYRRQGGLSDQERLGTCVYGNGLCMHSACMYVHMCMCMYMCMFADDIFAGVTNSSALQIAI